MIPKKLTQSIVGIGIPEITVLECRLLNVEGTRMTVDLGWVKAMSKKTYVPENWALGTTEERIHHLRRIILVHSILYYRFDKNIVSDHIFDSWSQELVALQTNNQEASEKVLYYREAYREFDGSSGYYLPLYDKRATNKALWLWRQLGGEP